MRRPTSSASRRRFLGGGLGMFALGLLTSCVAPRPLPGPQARARRIGWLGVGASAPGAPASANPPLAAFRQGLRELGYIEGQTLVIEFRYANDRVDRLPDLASELVQADVEVILAGGTAQALAAKRVTTTVPIVFANPGDPVENGLVASLARPGGNLTGLMSSNVELQPKRLELLKESVPTISRVAHIFNPDEPSNLARPELLEQASQALGLTLLPSPVGTSASFEPIFERAARNGADAVFCLASTFYVSRRPEIVALAAQHRLPAMYGQREFVDVGGLMSYAVDFSDLYRRAAGYVDKILKGARPADLPIEQPTRFDFLINLKTARALGLTIPQSVIQQVTEISQ